MIDSLDYSYRAANEDGEWINHLPVKLQVSTGAKVEAVLDGEETMLEPIEKTETIDGKPTQVLYWAGSYDFSDGAAIQFKVTSEDAKSIEVYTAKAEIFSVGGEGLAIRFHHAGILRQQPKSGCHPLCSGQMGLVQESRRGVR